ncbi:hypothetical protein [Novosphingobium sp.]|uniref:hypothetical protein n=1 Tax=Novosphingobium sp. TaxID=1874826 RepID=UPI0025FCC9E9|nr:hypothetical protein [Novosphingobium sp.]
MFATSKTCPPPGRGLIHATLLPSGDSEIWLTASSAPNFAAEPSTVCAEEAVVQIPASKTAAKVIECFIKPSPNTRILTKSTASSSTSKQSRHIGWIDSTFGHKPCVLRDWSTLTFWSVLPWHSSTGTVILDALRADEPSLTCGALPIWRSTKGKLE